MPTSSTHRLALVLPTAAEQIRAGETLPNLRTIIALSTGLRRFESTGDMTLEQWQLDLLSALSLCATEYPSAPVSWLGATRQHQPGLWLHADPVNMQMSAGGLTLEAARNWTGEELAASAGWFAEHLKHHDMAWHIAAGRAYLRAPAELSVETIAPHRAIEIELREALPQGPDNTRLRRVLTELQMLLHNQGDVPGIHLPGINAVWLWGAGSIRRPIASSAQPELPLAYCDCVYTRGIYALHHQEARCRALADFNVGADSAPQLLVLDGDARESDQQWLAPIATALKRGRLRQVELYLGGWYATARPSWRHWFRRAPNLAELLQ